MKNGMDCAFEFNLNRHCDDSGELSDDFMDDLDNCLMGKKSTEEARKAIIDKIREGEAVVYEGNVCVVVNDKLVILKEIDWDTLTDRML